MRMSLRPSSNRSAARFLDSIRFCIILAAHRRSPAPRLTSPRNSRRSRSTHGRSTPPECSSTATTTSPGGSAPRATSRFDEVRPRRSGSTPGQTDIPRLREGGVKAQFWSVYIPSEHPNPARTVTEQIDLVHRMVERYPDDLRDGLLGRRRRADRQRGQDRLADRHRRGRRDREQPGAAPRVLHASAPAT